MTSGLADAERGFSRRPLQDAQAALRERARDGIVAFDGRSVGVDRSPRTQLPMTRPRRNGHFSRTLLNALLLKVGGDVGSPRDVPFADLRDGEGTLASESEKRPAAESR